MPKKRSKPALCIVESDTNLHALELRLRAHYEDGYKVKAFSVVPDSKGMHRYISVLEYKGKAKKQPKE